jgi:hypothetical protein
MIPIEAWRSQYENSRYLREVHDDLLQRRFDDLTSNLWSTDPAGKPEVTIHVNHAWDIFNCCNNNRNHIFHSQLDLSHPPNEIRLTKGVKDDWNAINRIDLNLSQLRRVADDMFTGWEYVWDIWAYLQRRDLAARMNPIFSLVMPSALPQKPDLPRSLNPIQNPRAQPI